ncbi:MAG: EAL domain-containing response regulator [Deltaproteobacteria bacterium]|nr:MAG: EAL domain-containing response regulator [Deltaproteobacteria bacterium]
MGADLAASNGERAPRVLLVDDEVELLVVWRKVLESGGYQVDTAEDGETAEALFKRHRYDVIATDLTMPGMDGIELLRRIREIDLDVPVILITAAPSLESAIEAVEYGALKYVLKPVRNKDLLETIGKAVRLRKLAQLKREALSLVGAQNREIGDPAGLEVTMLSALDKLEIHYHPIVQWSGRRVMAYEALVRSGESKLPHPGALFDAAERLGRVHELSRAIRRQAAAAMAEAPDGCLLFLNLHPSDLEDPELYDPEQPIAQIAERVVLEVTERSSLEGIRDITRKVAKLREMGFRIAVDDLGAGYAGLTSFSLLEPEVVKLDMALVRGVDGSPTKQKVIQSMARLCREMGVEMVVEGIETDAEREAVVELGGDLLQGYLFAKPGPAFPQVGL